MCYGVFTLFLLCSVNAKKNYIFFSPNVSCKHLILQMVCGKQRGSVSRLLWERLWTSLGNSHDTFVKAWEVLLYRNLLNIVIATPSTPQTYLIMEYFLYKNKIFNIKSLIMHQSCYSGKPNAVDWQMALILHSPSDYAVCHVTLGCFSTLALNLAMWLGQRDVSKYKAHSGFESLVGHCCIFRIHRKDAPGVPFWKMRPWSGAELHQSS